MTKTHVYSTVNVTENSDKILVTESEESARLDHRWPWMILKTIDLRHFARLLVMHMLLL